MKVYDGANWIAATSAGNTSLLNYRYVATAGQTTFSGADANVATLSYAPNNIIVSRNGAVLDPTDYTATNGTSVVLINAAIVGDNINIVAFKSFTTADMVPASTGGTFNGGVNVTGNLGVGTTSPAASVSITKQTTALSGTGNAYGLYAYPTSSGLAYIDAVTSGSGNTSLGFRTYNNGTYNDAVRIDNSGNVGIGTSSPGARLQVTDGNFNQLYLLSSTTVSGIRFGNTAYTNGYIYYDNGANLTFQTNGAERARIDSSGSLLVGLTSSQLGVAKFQVLQSAADWTCFFRNTANNSGVAITNGSGTSSYTAIGFYNNGNSFSACGTITVSGTTTTYSTSSDYRLKENVHPMTSGLEKVSALKPVTYQWKSDGSYGEGFLAHELQEIVPFAVTGQKDEIENFDVRDEDGNVIRTEERIKPQGVDYSKIVVHLVAAIQELSAKNDALEARLAILEGATQ